MQARESVSLRQVGVGTFFVFRNSVEKLCVSWALPFIECVAVWALKLPVPHTDVLKTHESQKFSAESLESKKRNAYTTTLSIYFALTVA